MNVLMLTTGPVATNVWVLGDVRSREAIAIDTATPSVRWLTQLLGDQGWALRFIVSTHRHWDHIGDNAEAVIATGATLAAHQADRHGLVAPDPRSAPFPIPPSVPALDLAEGSRIRFGEIDLTVLHTPVTRRVRSASWAPRIACSSAATRSSLAAGDAPTCPVAMPRRWSSRWPD